MKRLVAALILPCLLTGLLAACATSEIPDRGILQAGCFENFSEGGLKGSVPLSRIARGADIGIGTFEGCDGELVVLDGSLYKISNTGEVSEMDGSAMTPFAVSAKVHSDFKVELKPGMTAKELSSAIDEAAVKKPGAFLAIRAHGAFASLKLRSAPGAKAEPYPPLGEVLAKQRVFDCENIAGTLVGFRTPAAYRGFNVPGYHFHFISDDRKIGGHVLALKASCGEASVQVCESALLIAPASSPSGAGGQPATVKGESAE